MLFLAIALITLALVLYTTGVWTEHRSGVLRWKHAALFGAGLAFDAAGTLVMTQIASSGSFGSRGGPLMGIMAVTGALAIALMAVHVVWAVAVLIRQRPSELATFHRLSLGVWTIWLLPYVTGAVGAAL